VFSFSKNNGVINSNWFVNGGNDYFRSSSGEKTLATYLNLFRFMRMDANKYKSQTHFICCVEDVYRSLTSNKRICKVEDVYGFLNELVKLKVIKFTSTSKKYIKQEDVGIRDRLIILDLDQGNCENYIYTPFDVVDYMLNNSLTYKHVSLFLLMMKWSTNPEKHCYIASEKMAEWLGYSNKTVLKYIKDMNELGVLVSVKKKSSLNRDCYYHTPIRKLEYVNGK